MCRDTINVSWQGEVFDCDFNQMLELPLSRPGTTARLHVWEIDLTHRSPKSRFASGRIASAAPPAADRRAVARWSVRRLGAPQSFCGSTCLCTSPDRRARASPAI